MKKISPLAPPEFENNNAIEILQVWVDCGENENSQKFSLLPRTYKDPAAWGLLLVDIARQVAAGYVATSTEEVDYQNILTRIKEGFDTEWNYPTD